MVCFIVELRIHNSMIVDISGHSVLFSADEVKNCLAVVSGEIRVMLFLQVPRHSSQENRFSDMFEARLCMPFIDIHYYNENHKVKYY